MRYNVYAFDKCGNPTDIKIGEVTPCFFIGCKYLLVISKRIYNALIKAISTLGAEGVYGFYTDAPYEIAVIDSRGKMVTCVPRKRA